MKKKSLIILSFSILLIMFNILSISAFAQNPIILKLSHPQPTTAKDHAASLYFKDLVEKNSNGRIKIDIYPASQLGKIAIQVEGVIGGTIEMGLHSLDHYANVYTDIQSLDFPFTFRSREQKRKLMSSLLFEEINEGLMNEKGVRILCSDLERGPYKVVLSNKPLFSIEDFENIKFRLPEIQSFFYAWKAIGVVPIQIVWKEVYLALRQGVVDALELPFSLIYPNKLYEVAPYVIVTKHLYQNSAFVINNQKYMSLPEDLREVVSDAAKKAGEYYTKLEAEAAMEDKAKLLSKGVVFIEIDIEPFFERVEPKLIQFSEEMGWSEGLVDKVLEFAKE